MQWVKLLDSAKSFGLQLFLKKAVVLLTSMVAVMASSIPYSAVTEPPHSYMKPNYPPQNIFHVGNLSSPRSLLSGYHGLKSPRIPSSQLMQAKPRRNSKWRSFGVIQCRTSLNVVFVGSEATPWSKTGGLADVLGGLPPALAERGHRVMTIVPRYDQYPDAWDTNVVVEVKVGEEFHNVRFFHSYREGVDRVFVDHPLFLEKVWGETGSKLYGPKAGKDYVDNNIRFSLLCKAALEAPRVLNLNCGDNFSGPYGEDVLFVCNDWHTALVPCYLKNIYQTNGIYNSAKSLLCIHNISYQGRFRFEEYSSLGLAGEFESSFAYIDGYCDPAQGLEMNWLKAGIVEVDKVLTVSPYYAQELTSHHFKGMGLEPVLQQRGVTGILNGTDVEEWNPATDKYIPFKYDISTVSDAKSLMKEALQAEVGLPVDRSLPLIGFMGRIEEQKGGDILAASLPAFIGEDVQLVALGMGKKKFERQLKQLEEAFPNKMSWVAKYCIRTAHMIMAGADYILVPSRFEPCGLIQMHAMRYGTVPIVSSTGGLVDTVKEGYTGFHMGAFNVDGALVDPEDVSAITTTVKRAIGIYGTPDFSQMVKNCMSQDLSWKEPAKRWEQVLMSMTTGTGAEAKAIGYEREVAPLAREVVTTV